MFTSKFLSRRLEKIESIFVIFLFIVHFTVFLLRIFIKKCNLFLPSLASTLSLQAAGLEF